MLELVKNIRIFFDITHPGELFYFGAMALDVLFFLIVLFGAFGLIIALVNFSLARSGPPADSVTARWLLLYDRFIGGFLHAIVVFSLLVSGFFACSTLANRYNDWEQAKISKIGESVSGEKMAQASPLVRYTVTFTDKVNSFDNKGKPVVLYQKRDETYNLNLSASRIKVNIDQLDQNDLDSVVHSYLAEFQAEYEIVNTLNTPKDFVFEVYQPSMYSMIQDFRVEQNGKRLVPNNPGTFNFSVFLLPGDKTQFSLKYKAQGGPHWVYEAYNQLLSNFSLTIQANFPNAEFASGIKPTLKKREGESTIFTWEFKDNVAVQNPFGIYTATESVTNTGVLPRLLLLAPAVLLWWLVLLYLSCRLNIRQVITFCAMFYAGVIALTYFSKVMDPMLAWLIVSILMLAFTFVMKFSAEEKVAVFASTIAGAIIPLFALIIPATGFTLSIAALLSAFWLALQSRNKSVNPVDERLRI